MSILKKINEARKKIKNHSEKKAGYNSYSEYYYFTPEQIDRIVSEVCFDLNIINTYELIREEHGLSAKVTVWNLDAEEENMTFKIATDIPDMKATNMAQKLGGAVTYSERYLLMSIYGIKDNTLDFDAQRNNSQRNKPKPANNSKPASGQTNFEARDLTKGEVEKSWNGKIYKGNAVYINDVKIIPSKEQVEKLKSHPKYKENGTS